MEQQAQQEPPQLPFSWGIWIGGLLLALVVGAPLNIISGLMATDAKLGPLGFVVGALPGALLILLYFALRKKSRPFALGLCTGACVIALIGGICGAAMVGTSFR